MLQVKSQHSTAEHQFTTIIIHCQVTVLWRNTELCRLHCAHCSSD